MEFNPICPLCQSSSIITKETPRFVPQYAGNNILITPTFSFITGGPPAKKSKIYKLTDEFKMVSPKQDFEQVSPQSTTKNIEESLNTNKIDSLSINKENVSIVNNNNSSWASSTGQLIQTSSFNMKPIVCIPDYSKNYKESINQTHGTQSSSTKNDEEYVFKTNVSNDINNTAISLSSTVSPKEIHEKHSGIKINLISNSPKVVKQVDNSESKLLSQSILPSISKFRIPKLKPNLPNDINNLKNYKGYIQTCVRNNKIKTINHMTRTSKTSAQNLTPKTAGSPSSLKLKPKRQSNDSNNSTLNHNKISTTKLPETRNNKQHQDLHKVCKFYKHGESLAPATKEKVEHSSKTYQSINKKPKALTKIKTCLKGKEDGVKKSEYLHNSLQQKCKIKTDKSGKLYKTTRDVSGKRYSPAIINNAENKKCITSHIKTDFDNLKEKVVCAAKSPLKYQVINENKNWHHENISNIKTQNPHTKPTKAVQNGNAKSLTKKTTVKSMITPTNNFDLNYPSNKNYSGVEDLRKKLNRVQKRENLIISVPNRTNERNNITKSGKSIRSKTSKTKSKTIKLTINLICATSKEKKVKEKVDKNENRQVASLDLSFLDDFNVDEIVESLNNEESTSILENKNNEFIPLFSSTNDAPEPKYSKIERTVAVKHESAFPPKKSKTSGITTRNYEAQDNCVKIKNEKTQIQSKNIETGALTTRATSTYSKVSIGQNHGTCDTINDYNYLEMSKIQKGYKNEVNEVITILDEEPFTDTLFAHTQKYNNIIKKEDDIKIKSEVTLVKEEPSHTTSVSLSTTHFFNSETSNGKVNMKISQESSKKSRKEIKDEMITEIILLSDDDDDKPIILSSLINADERQINIQNQAKEKNKDCLDITNNRENNISKNNIEAIAFLEGTVTDTLNNSSKGQYDSNTVHKVLSNINGSLPPKKMYEKTQEKISINTGETCAENILNSTDPTKANLEIIITDQNDSVHLSLRENAPVHKFDTVPKTNNYTIETNGTNHNTKSTSTKTSDHNLASSETLDIKLQNIDIEEKSTNNLEIKNRNQDEVLSVNNAQKNVSDAVASSKMIESIDTISVPRDKEHDETRLKQIQDTSCSGMKNSNALKTNRNVDKLSGAGILKTPYEENLLKSLRQRMLTYLGVKYDIGLLIRRGKYSTVFQCKDSKTKTIYAVKIINKEQDRHTLGVQKELILKELQKDIPKNNQYFVYLINGFGVEGRWCFLMEYYPKNLQQVFDDKKECFHIDVVQELSRQLVSAVMVLRNKNIVHSAIKPGHILINDTMNSLKLCGFDESRPVDQVVLLPNLGTPSYRAPELILGYSDGFSIDVWSTALVMYEMATGRKLFPGTFNNDILYKQMKLLGNIPFEMVQSSIYKDHHFRGTCFMKRYGYLGKEVILINHFNEKSLVRTNIFNAYNKAFGKTRSIKENIIAKTKLRKLVDLLNQMLILNPRQRLSIEFVYADPFILTFNDDCLLWH